MGLARSGSVTAALPESNARSCALGVHPCPGEGWTEDPARRPSAIVAPSRGEGGLTSLLLPEQPEERREPALRGVANDAHRGGVVADVLFGALLHSTRLRPGLDLADAELLLRPTLDLGVAGKVTQGRASVTQQLHAPMIGAQTDKAAVLALRMPIVYRSICAPSYRSTPQPDQAWRALCVVRRRGDLPPKMPPRAAPERRLVPAPVSGSGSALRASRRCRLGSGSGCRFARSRPRRRPRSRRWARLGRRGFRRPSRSCAASCTRPGRSWCSSRGRHLMHSWTQWSCRPS